MKKLESFAKEKWENVLLYILGTPAVDEDVCEAIKILLQWSNLVHRDPNTEVKITSEGFQFLLQDVHSQVMISIFGKLNFFRFGFY